MEKIRLYLLIILVASFFPLSLHSLTVDEVLQLKKAGVSDETIQMMIQHQMMREKQTDPYKNIGVRKIQEPDGSTATIYSTGEIKERDDFYEESEQEKREKAWEMLHNIVIDTRKSDSAKEPDTKRNEPPSQ